MKEKQNDDLRERVIEFAAPVLDAVESLPNSRVGNHVAGQFIRAGTSGAPIHGEEDVHGRQSACVARHLEPDLVATTFRRGRLG
ncbi:MAG: hypothetical protein ACQESR_00765 [Planctomycetota bacterium]